MSTYIALIDDDKFVNWLSVYMQILIDRLLITKDYKKK